jgi:bacterioferritin-associated ferredoxin
VYVCICNAIKEIELRETVHKGARNVEGAYSVLSVQFKCAQCKDHAQNVINDEIDNLK